MRPTNLPHEDDAPEDDLGCHYPLDGYDALGQLIHRVTLAACRHLRAAHARRRELRQLDHTYSLPAYDAASHRPIR